MVGFAKRPVGITTRQRIGANLIHHRRRHDLKIRGIRIKTKLASNFPDLLDGFLEFLDLFIFHNILAANERR